MLMNGSVEVNNDLRRLGTLGAVSSGIRPNRSFGQIVSFGMHSTQ